MHLYTSHTRRFLGRDARGVRRRVSKTTSRCRVRHGDLEGVHVGLGSFAHQQLTMLPQQRAIEVFDIRESVIPHRASIPLAQKFPNFKANGKGRASMAQSQSESEAEPELEDEDED